MSDTPETANAAFAASDVHEDCGVVYAEFAEQLERERNEWREVAEGNLLGVIHERDEAERRASESINQVGKMLLRNVRLKAANNEIRSGFLCLVADLQNTIARLRDECDLWKSEAEQWREINK